MNKNVHSLAFVSKLKKNSTKIKWLIKIGIDEIEERDLHLTTQDPEVGDLLLNQGQQVGDLVKVNGHWSSILILELKLLKFQLCGPCPVTLKGSGKYTDADYLSLQFA